MDEMLRSTAPVYGENIDCRTLSLSFEYYDLSYHKTIDMIENILQWLSDEMGDSFVSKMKMGPVHTKNKMLPFAKDELLHNNGIAFTQESFVCSPVIYNTKTMADYINKSRYGSQQFNPFVSTDYLDVWQSLFSEGCTDKEQIKWRIFSLFDSEDRYFKTKYHLPDAQAFLSAIPYENDPAQFYGRFSLNISVYCLGQQLGKASNEFASFAQKLSMEYTNLNARVACQPIDVAGRSSYMRYFGANAMLDDSHLLCGRTKKEWYPTYYIPGVEWYNIVAPRAKQHVLNRSDGTNDVAFSELSNGALIAYVNKSIAGFSVSDARKIKRFLSSALYPGQSSVPLRLLLETDPLECMFDIFPRSRWEIVPVFADEISIIGNELVFSGEVTS